MKDNVVLEKAYKFALHIVRLYRKLTEEKHEYVLSKTAMGQTLALTLNQRRKPSHAKGSGMT